MSTSVAKITEITAESSEGFDQAIRTGIERASRLHAHHLRGVRPTFPIAVVKPP